MQGAILLSGEPGKEKQNALVKTTGREESSFYIQRVGTDTNAFVKGLFSLPDDIRLPIFTGKGVVRENPPFATVIYMAERRPERRTLLLSADLVRSLSGFITALQILAAGRAMVGNK
ncbi:MAG: hypothetical protein AABZ62_01715 [Planctomycetota bacterium]